MSNRENIKSQIVAVQQHLTNLNTDLSAFIEKSPEANNSAENLRRALIEAGYKDEGPVLDAETRLVVERADFFVVVGCENDEIFYVTKFHKTGKFSDWSGSAEYEADNIMDCLAYVSNNY